MVSKGRSESPLVASAEAIPPETIKIKQHRKQPPARGVGERQHHRE